MKKAKNQTIKTFCQMDLKLHEPTSAGSWHIAGDYMAVQYKFIDDRHIKLSITSDNAIKAGINQAKVKPLVLLENIQIITKECYEDLTTYDFREHENEFNQRLWTCDKVNVNRLEAILTIFEKAFSKQYAFYLTRLDYDEDKNQAYIELIQSVSRDELLVMKGNRRYINLKDYKCNKEDILKEINFNIKYYKSLVEVI